MGGPWAFSKMFDDRAISSIDNRSYRGVFERADCEPTDNAAEVQVFDPIAPNLITDVPVTLNREQAVMQTTEESLTDATRPF